MPVIIIIVWEVTIGNQCCVAGNQRLSVLCERKPEVISTVWEVTRGNLCVRVHKGLSVLREEFPVVISTV